MLAVEVKLQAFLTLKICTTSTPTLPLREKNLGYILVGYMYNLKKYWQRKTITPHVDQEFVLQSMLNLIYVVNSVTLVTTVRSVWSTYRIIFQRGKIYFSVLLGDNRASSSWVLWAPLQGAGGGCSGQCVKLNTLTCLVPSLRMHGSTPPLPSALTAWVLIKHKAHPHEQFVGARGRTAV
jgi:hypothetical protein